MTKEGFVDWKDIISKVVISSIGGHSGTGMFPLTLLPTYSYFLDLVRNSGVTSIAKSATLKARIDNFVMYKPWTYKYVQEFGGDGLLNAYGLTNPGVLECARLTALANNVGTQVIPSYFIEFSDKDTGRAKDSNAIISDTVLAIASYQNVYWHILGKKYPCQKLEDSLEAIELNLSCPNSGEDLEKNISQALEVLAAIRKRFLQLWFIGKISIVHPYEFAQELERIGINMLHAVNTIPFNCLYPNEVSPLAAVGGGGVSGGPAFDSAYQYNRELRKKVKLPILMGCGVTSVEKARQYFGIGANAVSICTVARRNIIEAEQIIKTFMV